MFIDNLGHFFIRKALKFSIVAILDILIAELYSVSVIRFDKMYLYGNGVERDVDLALSYLNSSAEHGNEYAAQLLYSLSHSKNPSVAMAAFRLLQHLARILQNRLEDERKSKENQTDKKLRRIIDAKREAHGLKHGYGNIAKEYGYHVSVVDLRNPTRSNGNNLLHLVNKYCSDLPHRAVSVYIYLDDRANKDGECWPSISTIAKELKLSQSTVRRALRDLRKADLIETEQRYRKNDAKSSLLYKLKPK